MGDIKAILRRHMNRRLYFALSKVKRSPSVVLRVAKNELAVRPAIVRSEKPNTGPKDWFSGIDDETWLWMNTTGRRRHKAIARLLPEMPEASIQEVSPAVPATRPSERDSGRINFSRSVTRRTLARSSLVAPFLTSAVDGAELFGSS